MKATVQKITLLLMCTLCTSMSLTATRGSWNIFSSKRKSEKHKTIQQARRRANSRSQVISQESLNDQLRESCLRGNVDLAQALLSLGANPNAKNSLGFSILDTLVLTYKKRLEMITFLIENKAHLESMNPFLFDPNNQENNSNSCTLFFETLKRYCEDNNNTQLVEGIAQAQTNIFALLQNDQAGNASYKSIFD